MNERGRVRARKRLPEGVAGMARLHELIGEQLGEDADDADGRGRSVSSSNRIRYRRRSDVACSASISPVTAAIALLPSVSQRRPVRAGWPGG
jgi:hypothetical protein